MGEGTSTNRQLTGVKTGINKIGTAVTKKVPVHTIPYESEKFVESLICMSTEETETFVQGNHFKLEDEKGPSIETEEEQEIEIIKVTCQEEHS